MSVVPCHEIIEECIYCMHAILHVLLFARAKVLRDFEVRFT